MKKNKKSAQTQYVRTAKPRRMAIFVAILTIVLIALAWFVFVREDGTTLTDSEPAKTSGKADAPEVNSTKEANVASGNITTESVPKSKSFKVSNPEVDQSGGYVAASAEIQGIDKVNSQDKCVFLFETDGAKPVVRESRLSNKDTCLVGKIPEVEFAIIGEWNLKVTLFANDQRSEVVTKVDIK